jgi:hypothetical protein
MLTALKKKRLIISENGRDFETARPHKYRNGYQYQYRLIRKDADRSSVCPEMTEYRACAVAGNDQ